MSAGLGQPHGPVRPRLDASGEAARMQAIPRLPIILACLVTALAAAGAAARRSSRATTTCERLGRGRARRPVDDPQHDHSRDHLGGRRGRAGAVTSCWLRPARSVTPGSTPKLASLESKALSDEASAFRFDGQTCVGHRQPRPGDHAERGRAVAAEPRGRRSRDAGRAQPGGPLHRLDGLHLPGRDRGARRRQAVAEGEPEEPQRGQRPELRPAAERGPPVQSRPSVAAAEGLDRRSRSLGTATVSGQRAFVYRGDFSAARPDPRRSAAGPGQADGGQAQAARRHAGERHHLPEPRRRRRWRR